MRILTLLLLTMVGTTGQVWALDEPEPVQFGTIVYTGTAANDGGALTFYKSTKDVEQGQDAITLTDGVSAALTSDDIDPIYQDAANDDFTVIGYRFFIMATPAVGHRLPQPAADGTVSFIRAEVVTPVQQARRRTSGSPTIEIGQTLPVKFYGYYSGWNSIDPATDYYGLYYVEMPADANLSVNITATFPVQPMNTEKISYVDADGTTKSKAAGEVYVLDGTEDRLGYGSYNNRTEHETWYVLPDDLTYTNGLELYGKVHLILADGKTMTYDGTETFISGYGALDIYGQGGTTEGAINATTTEEECLNVYGGVTINGGHVSAESTHETSNSCYGIRVDGTLTINRGIVSGKSKNDGISGITIIINGGTVSGTGSNSGIFSIATSINPLLINPLLITGGHVCGVGDKYGIAARGDINITGGQIEATGGTDEHYAGMQSEAGDIILGWTNPTDYIKANRYYCGTAGKAVKMATGQRLVAFNAATGTAATTIVSGTVDDVMVLAGKTLRPLDSPVVSISGEGFAFGKDADFVIGDTPYYIYNADDPVTLSYTGSGIVQVTGTTLSAVENQPMQRSFTMPATDVALTATTVTDLTATDIIYGEATPEIKQGDDVLAPANYAFVYKSGDEVITEPTVGTYTCTLTGQGQYFGTTTVDITVKPRPITIAGGSATKKYDGTPLTSPYYECTLIDPDNRLNGIPILNNDSIANLTITGSQTNVGSSTNVPSGAVITRRGDATVDITSNYDIIYAKGTLTVTTNDKSITVIPGSSSKYYDGTPLTMTAHDDFEVTASDDFEVTGFPEALTWEATADGIVTNVTPGEGEKSENAVTSFKIFDSNHLDVTSYFTNINKDQVGTLTILPRQTTIALEIVDPETTVDGHPILISGDDAHVKVTLSPVAGEGETNLPAINGIATISVKPEGREAKPYTVAIVNGEGHYYVTNLAQAAYDFTATFDGDANHAKSTSDPNYSIAVSNVKTALRICFDKTDMTANTKVVTVGEPVTVNVDLYTVPSDWDGDFAKASSFNSDEVVTVKCNPTWQTDTMNHGNYTVGLVNGHGSITFSHLAADDCYYHIDAVYAGNDEYLQCQTMNGTGNQTLTLKVNKTATTVGVEVTSPVIAK